ncbi:hypothetical protein M422DRAFT_254582 [Sphaerobolus stellatus SS14]|uniref:Uncharacterized protein n=1 Tax=Sphaerobolus stellatus (strain SS14) TaxID=990650 RepID=A0A0C9UGK3_SPHS4|nr:hypothetical protein M422DRAFT_254582 [Sphaerobolus stellatus SS14]
MTMQSTTHKLKPSPFSTSHSRFQLETLTTSARLTSHMTTKSKNTSNPIEAVKRPAFRFSNSPPPAASLSNRKAHYASKHGEAPSTTTYHVHNHNYILWGFRKPQWKPLQLQMMRTETAAQDLNHNPQGIQHHIGMRRMLIGHHDNDPDRLRDHLLRVEEEVEVIQTLTTLTKRHYYYSESSNSDSDEDNIKKGIKLRDPDTYDGTNPEKL